MNKRKRDYDDSDSEQEDDFISNDGYDSADTEYCADNSSTSLFPSPKRFFANAMKAPIQITATKMDGVKTQPVSSSPTSAYNTSFNPFLSKTITENTNTE